MRTKEELIALYRALSKSLADETLSAADIAAIRRNIEYVRAEIERMS